MVVYRFGYIIIIYWFFHRMLLLSQCFPVPLALSPNPNEPLKVYHQIQIVSISSLDTSQAEFDVDLFLIQRWNLNKSICSHYAILHDNYTYKAPLVATDGALTIIEPDILSQIWLPRTHIAQVKSPINPTGSFYTDGFVIIYEQKTINQCMIKYIRRLSIKVECQLDFRLYPRDTQDCPIDFTSAFWSKLTLNYLWSDDPFQIDSNNLEQNDYSLNISTEARIAPAYDGNNRTWLTLRFVFRRKMGHFILEIIIPSIFIIISAYFSFFISIDTGSGRFAFSARPLFNLIVLYSSYKAYLPPLSYVNAGDIWMLGNLCFGFVTISGVAFCVHFWQKEEIKPSKAKDLMKDSGQIRGSTFHRSVNLQPSKRPFTVSGFVNGDQNQVQCNCFRCRGTFILKYFHFPKCSVHPMPDKLIKRSQYHDAIMKIVYPIAFLIFNIVYWMYLLHSN